MFALSDITALLFGLEVANGLVCGHIVNIRPFVVCKIVDRSQTHVDSFTKQIVSAVGCDPSVHLFF